MKNIDKLDFFERIRRALVLGKSRQGNGSGSDAYGYDFIYKGYGEWSGKGEDLESMEDWIFSTIMIQHEKDPYQLKYGGIAPGGGLSNGKGYGR